MPPKQAHEIFQKIHEVVEHPETAPAIAREIKKELAKPSENTEPKKEPTMGWWELWSRKQENREDGDDTLPRIKDSPFS